MHPAAAVPVLAAGALLVAVTGGEAVHAAAYRRSRSLRPVEPGAPVVVVILGFRDAGTTANMVNRWRARIGVRTARRLRGQGCAVSIVCSGGPVHGLVPEAQLLRAHTRGSLGWQGPIAVEPRSTSTWENVLQITPMIPHGARVVFASNGLHAEKARAYLDRQRPDLGPQIAGADDYRFGEMALVKPIFAAVGLWKLATMRPTSHARRTHR